jgi:uncharacterized protein
VGAHQDGLAHVSQLANKFVKDPKEVVKPGDIVKVKVVEVDVARKRLALTMRLDVPIAVQTQNHNTNSPRSPAPAKLQRPEPTTGSAMVAAFATLKKH